MRVHDAAEHDVGVAVGDDLHDLAFEVRLGFADPERPHFRRGTGVRPAQANSSSSRGKSPEVKFIRSRRSIVTMLATNSGTSRRLVRLSLTPVEPNAT